MMNIMDLSTPEASPETPGIWIFGEVLFDTFPDGTAVLGGAPFNVAWNLTAFQAAPRIISAVGNDAPGQLIQERMHGWQMNCEHLAVVPEYPTGKVTIRLINGDASYTIEENQAYDNIPLDCLPNRTEGFLYFGSLALRTAHNRAVLAELKKRHQGKVFIDINLRPPFWDKGSILALVQDAHWLKMNEAELALIAKTKGTDTGTGTDIESQARQLKADYGLDGIVVTCGSRGAFALGPNDNAIQVRPEQVQDVQDTVGAGDAFASALLLGLVQSWPLQDTLKRAQQFASGVVGIQGAVSPDSKFYQQHLQSW
ncbi:MAG: PfkB family carbohydrate kinase [Candidatus Electrothrix sp.]